MLHITDQVSYQVLAFVWSKRGHNCLKLLKYMNLKFDTNINALQFLPHWCKDE